MPTRAELLAEAYRRNLLPPDKRALYEEGVRRGLVDDAYARGRVNTRGAGKVSAVASTINETIPFADELAAGAGALLDTARGRGDLGKTWRANRNFQSGQQDELRDKNPVTSNLSTGVGYAIQAAPALMTGGATATPQAGNWFARMGMGTAKNATVGAAYTAGSNLAGRGDLQERVQAADASIIPGAIAGVVAPAIMGTPRVIRRTSEAVARGPVGRTTVRAVNNAAERVTGKGFLDPRQEALKRLGETLKADGLNPEQISAAINEWNRVGGPSPAFMDIVAKNGGGQQTMALIRGSAMKGPGRTVATRYGDQVGADLQDNAIARTGQLVRDRRTVPQVERELDATIRRNSQAPEVQPGSGGAVVSRRLNEGYDAARGQTNAAYDAVRNARPEQAMLQRPEAANIAVSVREATRDFNPNNVPRVAQELKSLDSFSTPNLRDYFDLRSRLSALRASADPVERAAASRAVQALDGELDRVVSGNLVTGDASVLAQARAATAARRAQGQQYESGDLIANLVSRENRGGGMTNTVAPEDASRAILGTGNGFGTRPDLTRDLTRLRDTLGPDSQEWNALRREALSRTLGVDANSPNFGQAFLRLERDNPQLAGMLITPNERAALMSNRANLATAQADRQALEVGQRVLNAKPDEYASDIGSNIDLSRLGAARELEARIGAPTEGATGVLNRISTATNPGRNLRVTFGDQAANDYRQAIGQMVEQVQNARFINPNTGSQSAGRLADEALVENIPTSKIGLLKAFVDKVRSGATLTPAEQEAIVQIATSRGGAPEGLDRVFMPPPPRVEGPRFNRANLFALPMAQENRP